jgi:hypothetical protein
LTALIPVKERKKKKVVEKEKEKENVDHSSKKGA